MHLLKQAQVPRGLTRHREIGTEDEKNPEGEVDEEGQHHEKTHAPEEKHDSVNPCHHTEHQIAEQENGV